jgi:DNA-binding HxlR family transcriptional regulator
MADWNFFLAKRLLRDFEREHLRFISSIEDLDVVWAIGYGQRTGKPISLKDLCTGEFGAPKTVRRRIERLRGLGIVEQSRSDKDRRRVEYCLTDKTLEALETYKRFIVDNGMSSRDESLAPQPRSAVAASG